MSIEIEDVPKEKTEIAGMWPHSHISEAGEPRIGFSGQWLASLINVRFGLCAKEGVTAAELDELAQLINQKCDGFYATYGGMSMEDALDGTPWPIGELNGLTVAGLAPMSDRELFKPYRKASPE